MRRMVYGRGYKIGDQTWRKIHRDGTTHFWQNLHSDTADDPPPCPIYRLGPSGQQGSYLEENPSY